MRKYLPLLFLALLIVSDAFLKVYVRNELGTLFSVLLIPAVALFLLSLLCLGGHFSRDAQNKNFWDELGSSQDSKRYAWILIAILLSGVLLRFWKLDSLLEGMLWDEAYKGLDAIAIREFGERPIFLNWNAGREAMVAYLVAVSQYFWDYSIFSVRVVQATAGCLTILFFYLFVKTIFNRNLALLSAFLMTFSKWHLIHTRYGIRVALIVLFEVAALYFLARGLLGTRNKSWFIVVAGALTGLGFYTYIAYRAFPFVLIAFALDPRIRIHLRKNFRHVAAALIVALLIAAPLFVFFVKHRDSFTDRMKRTAVWNQPAGQESSAAILILESTVDTLGMFTFRGDEILRLNVNGEPMLSPFSTSFFVLGFLLTLLHIRKPYAVFLLVYFVMTLLPGFLTGQSPHSSRTLGSLPPAMLFVSFGIIAAIKIVSSYSSVIGRVFLFVILGGNLLTGTNDGLFRYAVILERLSPGYSALWGMERDQANVAELLNRFGRGCDVFLSPQFYFHSGIEYLTRGKSEHKLFNPANFASLRDTGKVTIVILQPADMNLWWLRDEEGKDFFKWWEQSRGLEVKKIRWFLRRTYTGTGRIADKMLLKWLEEKYPSGRILRLNGFAIFVIREF